jgi:hypothetical protein
MVGDIDLPPFGGTMSTLIKHDAFARASYMRTCKGPGACAWCGQWRERVFTYVWVSDGAFGGEPSIFVRHQADYPFCNFACFEYYHS